MAHIFCDESGNTGAALLDPEQPFFALASTSLDEQSAEDLLAPLRKSGQTEIKYSVLKRTAAGQEKLLTLFSSALLQPGNCRFRVTDKKYYLISHLVDKLIEPTLHENGLNLYERDGHIGLTNIWFHAGRLIFPGGHWNRVLTAFLDAIRRRTPVAFSAFDTAVKRAHALANNDYRDFANGLLMAYGRLDQFIGCFGDLAVFDPACDDFAALMQSWMKDIPDRFDVTHDRSKPMAKNERILRAMMTPAPARFIGFAARKKELPLRIETLAFGDSVAHLQLQIADLIAGAAVDWCLANSGKRERQNYHAKLAETPFPTFCAGTMLPSLSVEDVQDPAPGEVSLVDGNTAFLREVGFFDKNN